MIKKTLNLLIIGSILFMITACKPISNPSLNSTERIIKQNNRIGHFKMGLINYEIIDSSKIEKEVADIMINMMKGSLEYEVIYSENKYVEIEKDLETSEMRYRGFYDKDKNLMFVFKYKNDKKYLNQLNLDEMLSEIPSSNNDSIELSKMFIKTKFKDGGRTILNFNCDKIALMQPDDLTKESAIFFTTNKIPYVTSSFGPMGEFIEGMPLLTIMFINGLKIETGALSHKSDQNFEKYLHFDESEYIKLDFEEFDNL